MGITGFDPQKSTQDLNSFKEALVAIYNKGKEVFTAYNEGMYTNWASPQANFYSRDLIDFPAGIANDLRTMHDAILSTAINAVLSIANANGYRWNYSFEPIRDSWETKGLKESHDDGRVGMVVSKVDATVKDFTSGMEQVMGQMDAIPLDLSIFDAQGHLVDLYKRLINGYKEKLTETIERTVEIVNNVSFHETNKLSAGVNQAASYLG